MEEYTDSAEVKVTSTESDRLEEATCEESFVLVGEISRLDEICF